MLNNITVHDRLTDLQVLTYAKQGKEDTNSTFVSLNHIEGETRVFEDKNEKISLSKFWIRNFECLELHLRFIAHQQSMFEAKPKRLTIFLCKLGTASQINGGELQTFVYIYVGVPTSRVQVFIFGVLDILLIFFTLTLSMLNNCSVVRGNSWTVIFVKPNVRT